MHSEGTYGRHRDNVAGQVGIKPFLVHIWLSNQLERFVQTNPVSLEDPGHPEGSIPYWRPFEINEYTTALVAAAALK